MLLQAAGVLRSACASPSHLKVSSLVAQTTRSYTTPRPRLLSLQAPSLHSQIGPLRQPQFRPQLLASRTPSPTNRRAFFSKQHSRYYQNRQSQYNRFRGNTRQDTLYRLVQNAKPRHFVIIGVGISGVYLYNTEKVEMTGRRQFNCISRHQELKMGEESYQEILSSERGKILSDHHPLTRMVNGVLQRLIPQAPIEGANWKVHVIKDDGMVNAFVLPG